MKQRTVRGLMRRSGLREALATIALLALASCTFDTYGLDELWGRASPVDERVCDDSVAAPSAPPVADTANYAFIVASDMHFTESTDPAIAAAPLASLVGSRGAAFVIVCGDLTDAGRDAAYALYAPWASTLGVPVYAVPGNHDLYNDGWTSFRGRVGRSCYSFAVGDRTFYFVDTGNGAVGRVQLSLLRGAFAADANAKKVIVSHYPLYGGEEDQYYRITNTAERAALIDLYANGGVELLLEGHTHKMQSYALGPMAEWQCSCLDASTGHGRCVVVTVSGGEIASVAPAAF